MNLINKHVALIDVSAVGYAGMYSITNKPGIPGLFHEGQSTGIIFDFLMRMRNFQYSLKPDLFVFTCDSKESLRSDLFPDYKVKRNKNKKTDAELKEMLSITKPQILRLQYKLLPYLGFNNILCTKGLEADDIQAKIILDNPSTMITVVSRDKDLRQTLKSMSRMYDPVSRKLYTHNDLMDDLGCTPEEWQQAQAIAGCFDAETDILTDRGWVNFPEVTKQDRVYSMDPTTHIANYEAITNVIQYEYTGPMYHFEGQVTDLLVTPNHSLFGESTIQSKLDGDIKFKEVQAIEGLKNFTVPLTSTWQGSGVDLFSIPALSTYARTRLSDKLRWIELPAIDMKMDDWCAFLGLYLAEGNTSKNRNGRLGEVHISQTKQHTRELIKPMLDKLPFKWLVLDNSFKTNSVQLANYLSRFGDVYHKYIPQYIKDLSVEQLSIFLKWAILGDGCISNGRTSYFSCNHRLISDMQEIIIKCGNHSTLQTRLPRPWAIKGKVGMSKEQYTIEVNKKSHINIKSCKLTKVPFQGMVYDVTTSPHHTILVRRKGKVIWSSNCPTDEVPGIPGVAIKTALKYIKGEMNPKTMTYQKIADGKATIALTKKLVTLPFAGTPSYKLKPNNFDNKKLRRLAQQFNFDSIDMTYQEWRFN